MNPLSTSPKVLLLGDYSNCHRTLATGLRGLGCDVTVASDGSRWMDCERDIDISRRRQSKAGGMLHYLNMEGLLRGKLSGFDVVAVNDPMFTTLRPERLDRLFALLKRNNGGVFYTAMSTDLPYLDMLPAADSPLRYSEWFIGGKPSRMYMNDPSQWDKWHNDALVSYQNRFF